MHSTLVGQPRAIGRKPDPRAVEQQGLRPLAGAARNFPSVRLRAETSGTGQSMAASFKILATILAVCRGGRPNSTLTVRIPGEKVTGTPIKHDRWRYRRRSRIEMMFRRLKGWRRVATRYGRYPKVFLNAITLAATVLFWL